MQKRLKSLYATLCFALVLTSGGSTAGLELAGVLSPGSGVAFAQGSVSLNAKKNTKKPNNKGKPTPAKARASKDNNKGSGKGKGRAPIRAAAPLPVSGRFAPLFGTPAQPPAWMAGDFVGRDPEITGEMNFTAQAAAARASQIRQTASDFRLQKPGSQPALQVGANLIRLYEEQAMYLENVRGLGLRDPAFSDINHAVKTTRAQLVNIIDQVLKQFPAAAPRSKWKATLLVSRIKIGDPSASRDALTFVRQAKGDEGQRVILTGVAWDAMAGRSKGSFGSIDSVLELDIDGQSRAAFKLFKAESLAKAKSNGALAAYEEAAKEGGAIRTPEGSLGPVSLRASARLIETALAQRSDTIDPDLVATLQGLGLLDAARYYAEQVALRSVARQPQRAMSAYADILQIGDPTPELRTRVEFRVLDIALFSRDPVSTEQQWARIKELPNGMQTAGVEPRIAGTQSLLWGEVTKKPGGENVDRFVRMHDVFAANNESYAANEDWALKTVEGLWRIKRATDTATRGDAVAAKARRADVKVAALRYSARARESILGVNPEPSYARRSKAAGNTSVIGAYVATLDTLSPLVKGDEADRGLFQGAYLTHQAGNAESARKRFEDALNRLPRAKYASGAVSYLIDDAQGTKDWVYVEKIARLAERKSVRPAEKRHADLRGIVEVAVFEQATKLAADAQHEAAANKFLAFQKEFPKSRRAEVALDTAAKNFVLAKKIDVAVTTMELLFGTYPQSPYAKEARWQSAELSKGLGQMLRAANHYEAFAKLYKKEGQQRQAWLKAADMHKGLGRYASAIADYEIYMKEAPAQEKVRVAKDIADMQFKFGKSTEALAAYDRVIKMSRNADDEIFARAQMIEIYMRMSQEANARAMISRVLDLKPASQDGFRTLARAKFSLAKLEARDMKDIDPMREAQLKRAVDEIVRRYDKVKSLYLASCEVPGLELCSVGYYETAKLAEQVAGKLLEVELPPTLDLKEVGPIKAAVTAGSKRLSEESKSFAQQAESALSSGAPDADTADRIRNYAAQHRGDASGSVPLE
ncbi:MAG: tetratricopeptide repeat protein [Silvanigrellales bacterium]|nr:tetratricopeptide repeat protein [Silvanigrellales bacterium]